MDWMRVCVQGYGNVFTVSSARILNLSLSLVLLYPFLATGLFSAAAEAECDLVGTAEGAAWKNYRASP